jgi:hypothetical protein
MTAIATVESDIGIGGMKPVRPARRSRKPEMLIVEALNIFTDKDDVADYDVRVRINTAEIWRGPVLNHRRKDGWHQLLRKIALAYEEEHE